MVKDPIAGKAMRNNEQSTETNCQFTIYNHTDVVIFRTYSLLIAASYAYNNKTFFPSLTLLFSKLMGRNFSQVVT